MAAFDRTILPIPSPEFSGKIGETYTDSTPDMPPPLTPPDGAPNVLLIMIDDVGFGQTSTFGGSVNTPHLQRLADEGIKYNHFHTTALCSPTRAALLTGRNHHTAHTGVIMELATGYPGYDGQMQKDTATVAATLGANGYGTAAFGKWHNTPDYELGPTGPFDRWPTGAGFGHFYGFLGGEANQWHTPLIVNTEPVEPPNTPGWHFSEAIADECISWISSHRAASPHRPFFAYFAPGAAHAPHHVAPEWADKYKGKFDHGWDKEREIVHQRQIEMGIAPDNTDLTPRPDGIPAWDSLSDNEKKLFCRMQEVFAGFLEHVDAQIGRIIEAIDSMGIADDTLIFFLVGDNGPSAEGSLNGTLNNMKSQQGFVDSIDDMLKSIDQIGGPEHENHYPVGWCWAGSSPFQWMKQVASHFGGTRNGMVVRWPGKLKDQAVMREQFHHVIDIVPTLLEVANLPEPKTVDGVEQKPLDGVSLAYTFADAKAKSTHITQYFEMFGNRAIYHDGWVAGCKHGKAPWQTAGSVSFDDDTWELYNITDDFSQAHDLAAEMPEKLEEMKKLFAAEADKHNVYPLDDRFAERSDASLRPNPISGVETFEYLPGTIRIPEPVAPNTKNVDHTLAADIEVTSGDNGVLVCLGGESGGWSLFLHEGHLVWEHNWFNDVRYRVKSDKPLPSGRHVVSAQITVDDATKPGTGGKVVLRCDDAEVGKGGFEKQVPFRFTVNETLDVGCDTVTPVSDLYESPGNFTGTINKVIIDISGQQVEDLETKFNIANALQ